MVDDNLKPAQIITLPEYSNQHDHNHSQVVVGLTGSVSFDIEGSEKIIGPGQGCIIPSTSIHRFLSVNEESKVLILNKNLDEAQQSYIQTKLIDNLATKHFFQLDVQIQQLIQMLINEIESTPADSVIAKSCSDTILALLEKHSSALDNSHKMVRLDIDAINRIIDANLAGKISVAQLAAVAYLGESQFYHRFKQQMGMTPHQYVMNRRIEWVKMLIEEQRYSLGQISEYCGFSSQSAMSTNFSNVVHLTPSSYRKLHAVKHLSKGS
jgi:AraC-like DNA-binding protein